MDAALQAALTAVLGDLVAGCRSLAELQRREKARPAAAIATSVRVDGRWCRVSYVRFRSRLWLDGDWNTDQPDLEGDALWAAAGQAFGLVVAAPEDQLQADQAEDETRATGALDDDGFLIPAPCANPPTPAAVAHAVQQLPALAPGQSLHGPWSVPLVRRAADGTVIWSRLARPLVPAGDVIFSDHPRGPEAPPPRQLPVAPRQPHEAPARQHPVRVSAAAAPMPVQLDLFG